LMKNIQVTIIKLQLCCARIFSSMNMKFRNIPHQKISQVFSALDSTVCADRSFWGAAWVGSGANFSMEKGGICLILTSIVVFDKAALEAAAGTIVDHKKPNQETD
jgi:hypothetical protein